MGSRALGVFGGTFNPVHLGHLHVARAVQQIFGLSRMHFVVASQPPHKPGVALAPFIHRFAMVALATAENAGFLPSAAEIEAPPSPFSVHTMRKFARRSGLEAGLLHFVAGSDSLLEISTWHRSSELLSSYSFIFVVRRGVTLHEPASLLPGRLRTRMVDLRGLGLTGLRARLRMERRPGKPRIYLVDVAAPDISASAIRSLAASGRRITRLVPEPVNRYIQKLRLYGER